MKAIATADSPTRPRHEPTRLLSNEVVSSSHPLGSDGWLALGDARNLQGPGPFAASVQGGDDLVIVRNGDGFKAFEGRCPHQGALLAEGEVSGGELVCRNHGWRFDVATGRRRGGPECLGARAVDVRDGQLFVCPAALAIPAAIPTRSRTIDELPGPRGWPVIGNALGLDLERLHAILERWGERYGPVFRVDLGRHRVLVTSDQELIQRCLRERPEIFRRLGNIEPVFRELGLDGVFSAEGVEWRPLRKLTMEALAPGHLRSFYPALRSVAERLHRRWSLAADDGREVDAIEDFKRFTVDLTTRLAFGHDLNTLEQDDDVLQRKLEQVFPAVTRRLFATVPLWRLVKLPADRRLEKALAHVFSFLRELLDTARARLAADPGAASHPATFLEAMLCARDDAGRPFSDRQILGNAIQILIAGEDTTALTLSWAIHELCDAPGVVAALQAEADEILAGSAVPSDFDAAGQLHLAGAVANETMRLRPVAPLMLVEANTDTVLGDLSLARGQRIFLLARLPARSELNFADPHAFRPERWLHRTHSGAHEPAGHIPFGSGPRLCPGRTLALLEMRVALATLFRSFAVERIGERSAVEERFAFTMGPRRLRVRLRHRARG